VQVMSELYILAATGPRSRARQEIFPSSCGASADRVWAYELWQPLVLKLKDTQGPISYPMNRAPAQSFWWCQEAGCYPKAGWHRAWLLKQLDFLNWGKETTQDEFLLCHSYTSHFPKLDFKPGRTVEFSLELLVCCHD
jgi:hypothetical protein